MKITRTSATTQRAVWLDKNQYGKYAEALVTSRLNKNDELTKAKMAELKTILDEHRNGQPTKQGKLVRVSWLLGAMNRLYGGELVDQLTEAVVTDRAPISEEDF